LDGEDWRHSGYGEEPGDQAALGGVIVPNSLTIRSVAPADFTQWRPLWEGYNRFYGRDAFSLEITQMTWSRFLDADEPVHAVVAEDDGQLVGLVHYLFHRSTIQIRPACYLQDLFTSEAARRQGVGRALIEAVYERARVAGCPRVYWHTHESNVTAMKLYDQVAEHSGFVVYRKQL
jgi:GNAT superfamily N-acetyltransferase